MARETAMASGYSSQEESDEGVYRDDGSATGGLGRRAAGAAFGAIGLVAVVAVLALRGSALPAAAAAPSSAAPLTVRALLESDELADLATKNLMAVGGEALSSADHGDVRGRVARGLRNVSEAIRTRYPEAHRELDNLQLTGDQKEASLHVLRKLGDPRLVAVARDVAEATRQAEQEHGDEAVLKRRLSEALAPRVREVQELSEELFPGQAAGFDASAAVPQLRKWHPTVSVDLSKRRRLSAAAVPGAADDALVEQGVQAHAHTLFKSLQAELGDKMPEAPARMLTEKTGGDLSFMECVMKGMPNPTKLCKCIADNMSEVVSMMKDFMKGKMR